jgi:hypothetical protein
MAVKVMWFLRRAEHLTLAEFRDWWLNRHVVDIVQDQKPFLRSYKIDVRVDDDQPFLGRPATESPWDGIAEQVFDTIADYNAVYSRADRPTRSDTLAHCSRFERLVVEEYNIPCQ